MKKEVTLEQIKTAAELLKKEHTERLRLEKVAEDASLRERAAKVAFREVELGVCEPYRTHEEFQTKVASLMNEDLSVVEKALERGYGSYAGPGELDNTPAEKQLDPLSSWVLHGKTNY